MCNKCGNYLLRKKDFKSNKLERSRKWQTKESRKKTCNLTKWHKIVCIDKVTYANTILMNRSNETLLKNYDKSIVIHRLKRYFLGNDHKNNKYFWLNAQFSGPYPLRLVLFVSLLAHLFIYFHFSIVIVIFA